MLERIARRMIERTHTNSRTDGICPWCHVSGGNADCDLEKLRALLEPSVGIAEADVNQMDIFKEGL